MSALFYTASNQAGWLISVVICLLVSACFALDYWHINHRIERDINDEMQRSAR